MSGFSRHTHPFRLLLVLEWILLGIALLALFSPLTVLHPPHRTMGMFPLALPFRLGAAASIVGLGLMGLSLPSRSWLASGLYTAAGFGLSWLAVLLGGRGVSIFPPLLLIVVIRACLLFPWSGRLLVAAMAYGSFLGMMLLAFLGIRPLGMPLGRPLPPRMLPDEALQGVLLGLSLNSALLFGLVLVFVLLLVGAVLAEYESRQRLTQANQRLRQYALLIEDQATLQERNRIAREIHDSVGHALAAQSIQLENVALQLPADVDAATAHLKKARQLGKAALQHVRQSVSTLRAHPLQGKPLPEAIAHLLQEFEQTTTAMVTSHIDLTSPLPPDTAIALYRITQEALTNVAKHSGAKQVRLRLQETPAAIGLMLADNGQGFDPSQNTTGFGLQSMRERAEAIGGQFSLTSQPGQGCRIQITVPTRGTP